MEKLFKIIQNVSKAQEITKVMMAVIENIKEIVNCSNA